MSYTLGYSAAAMTFMSRRTLATHGAFIQPWLRPDMSILDVACGPGSLTLDLARAVPQGRVVAIDREASQIKEARAAAAVAGVTNVEFIVGEAGRTALPPASFDLIFSHALLEHLSDPVGVLRQLRPALRPGGRIAVRSPDWGGFVLHPETKASQEALAAYEALQRQNGGDTRAGRRLGVWLTAAGYARARISATYEIYPDSPFIAEFLAQALDRNGVDSHGAALRRWAQTPEALFGIAWFEAIAEAG